MIGYWHHPVVCLSVTLCILALRVGVRGLKLFQRVPSMQVPIRPFRHFCGRMYRLAKMHHKSRVEETRVRISLYPLLTVHKPDHILSSLVSHATLYALQRYRISMAGGGYSQVQRCADCGRVGLRMQIHGNRDRSDVNSNDTSKLLDLENPLCGATFMALCVILAELSWLILCEKFPIFRYHGNRGCLMYISTTPLNCSTSKTPCLVQDS